MKLEKRKPCALQENRNMYLLQGSLKAKPGKREDLATILLKASKLVSTAKGCRLYLVSKNENETDMVYVTEMWDSKQDHDDSLNVKGVRELIMTAMPLLEGPPKKGQELDVLGGFGL